jgi:hypothetical protein
VYGFVVPALRKEREGRGTHFAGDANEIKSLGHPPEKDLKAAQAKDLLIALRNAIPESSSRTEDRNRRSVLSQLIRQPQKHLTEEECRWLGDAMFAFFCPRDAAILTTNVRDHAPLAEAIGKLAEKP